MLSGTRTWRLSIRRVVPNFTARAIRTSPRNRSTGRSVSTLVRTSNSIWLGREVESGDAFAYEGNPLAAFWLRSGEGACAISRGRFQLVSAWRVGSIQVLPALRRVSMQLLIQRTWCSIETNRLLSGRTAGPVTMNIGKAVDYEPEIGTRAVRPLLVPGQAAIAKGFTVDRTRRGLGLKVSSAVFDI